MVAVGAETTIIIGIAVVAECGPGAWPGPWLWPYPGPWLGPWLGQWPGPWPGPWNSSDFQVRLRFFEFFEFSAFLVP